MKLKEISNILPFVHSGKTNHSDPFEDLLSAPRFEPLTVQVDDFDFQIVDGLSFYWSFREIFGEEIYKFESCSDSP